MSVVHVCIYSYHRVCDKDKECRKLVRAPTAAAKKPFGELAPAALELFIKQQHAAVVLHTETPIADN